MPTGDMFVMSPDVLESYKRKRQIPSDAQLRSAEHLGITHETLRKIRNNEPVRLSTINALMESLGEDDISEVLTPESLAEYWGTSEPRPPKSSRGCPVPWSIVSKLGQEVDLPNGIRYADYQLCLSHNADHLARGKLYELDRMVPEIRYRSKEHLHRHMRICDKLSDCPHVATNLLTSPDQEKDHDRWWVIDQWYRGTTLAELMKNNAIQRERIPGIMRKIALGLVDIHKETVICRELTPEKIIYDFSDNRVVLTDFELGKLFDGTPTVRGLKWPKNDYRAPEIEDATPRKDDMHVDLYSWGRILVHAVTGDGKVEQGDEEQAITNVDLPKKVRDITLRCVDRDRRNRPKNATAVLRAIAKWK